MLVGHVGGEVDNLPQRGAGPAVAGLAVAGVGNRRRVVAAGFQPCDLGLELFALPVDARALGVDVGLAASEFGGGGPGRLVDGRCHRVGAVKGFHPCFHDGEQPVGVGHPQVRRAGQVACARGEKLGAVRHGEVLGRGDPLRGGLLLTDDPFQLVAGRAQRRLGGRRGRRRRQQCVQAGHGAGLPFDQRGTRPGGDRVRRLIPVEVGQDRGVPVGDPGGLGGAGCGGPHGLAGRRIRLGGPPGGDELGFPLPDDVVGGGALGPPLRREPAEAVGILARGPQRLGVTHLRAVLQGGAPRRQRGPGVGQLFQPLVRGDKRLRRAAVRRVGLTQFPAELLVTAVGLSRRRGAWRRRRHSGDSGSERRPPRSWPRRDRAAPRVPRPARGKPRPRWSPTRGPAAATPR